MRSEWPLCPPALRQLPCDLSGRMYDGPCAGQQRRLVGLHKRFDHVLRRGGVRGENPDLMGELRARITAVVMLRWAAATNPVRSMATPTRSRRGPDATSSRDAVGTNSRGGGLSCKAQNSSPKSAVRAASVGPCSSIRRRLAADSGRSESRIVSWPVLTNEKFSSAARTH